MRATLRLVGKSFALRLVNCIFILIIIFFYNQMMYMNQEVDKANKNLETLVAMQNKNNATVPHGDYIDGTYEGTAIGYGGPVTVQIKVNNGNLSAIEILSAENEDAEYYNMTLGILDEIMDTQGVDVDTVSGATFTSKGIINAAKKALSGAKKE